MTLSAYRPGGALAVLLLSLLLGGCATTSGGAAGTTDDVDPIEPVNRTFFFISETLDGMFVKPMAEIYTMAAPDPVRQSVGNFFANLGYLNVILNSFLQGKADQGWSDTSRFLINSTVGVGGLFDVATDMGYPAHNEDLGQTLAVWGAPQGAYLYIPVAGPNTVRDSPDLASSALTNPLYYVSNAILYPVAALGIISKRADLLEASRMRDEAALDAYVFTREAYLQQRQYLIHDGDPPVEDYDALFDFEYDEAEIY